jgi:leucyl aminopeptidase
MIPIINRIAEVPQDQSVVVVCGTESFPCFLNLGEDETGYVKRCIAEREEVIVLNNYHRVVIIVTEKSDLSPSRRKEHLRQLAARVRDIIRGHRERSIALAYTDLCEGSFEAFTEGLIMSLYTFNRHKSLSRKEKKEVFPESLSFPGDYETGWIDIFRDAIYFARDLVNEPLSHLTAAGMADRIREFVAPSGIRCEIYGMRKIEALKMGGVLAVNRGSLDPPAFVVMEWKPEGHVNTKPVILVGKGVVFDTGGVNLKPGDHMEEMKADMAGGAAVASAMYMAARKEIPLHIMAFVPASDNRPGVRAYVPGDVITMYNGTTVEVVNTDAEGRLLVADALSYADNFDPSLVVTVATLTGSAANTFGSHAIAMMGNADSETIELMEMAGEKVYERVASLPFWEEYGDMLKSDIADIRNLGGKEAGAVTAGKFLEKFTRAPLIHLDIAGTAMMKKDEHYRVKGATGSGTRLLTLFLEALAASEVKL